MNQDLLKSLELLIIEDSPTQAALLQNNLEHHQIKTRIAKDGLEGLEQLRNSLPDVIISDINMPRMNGYEFCKAVKTDIKFKEIPIILLTTLTDPLEVIKGIESGADSFLTKPCDINFLVMTIQDVIRNIDLQKNSPKQKLEFYHREKKCECHVNLVQITELLLSTYSSAIAKNLELQEAYKKLNNLYLELEQSNEKLKALNQQKNQFLGMAAHDLKNPLTVISGYSNFLLSLSKDNDFTRVPEMIGRINDSSTFMISIIDDLLDFSTIESGTLSLHLAEVDLVEMIKKDLLLFESLGLKKEIKINLNFSDSIPKIRCDKNKVAQVFNNLIGNAIKFSNPKSTINIFIEKKDNSIVVSIKDEGIGMSEEAQNNLFQPFSKTKTKGTAGEKGFGLGLAIVKKIINAHSWSIRVQSKIGSGTTFFITIPLEKTV